MYRTLPTERVSVVIPVTDDLNYLDRCLDALEMQTHPPHEIIVVDRDPSTRTSIAAASRGALVVRELNLTDAAATAAGYDLASGDIIARLDADSVPGVTWLATVCEAFAFHTGAAAVTGAGMMMEDDGRARRKTSSLYVSGYLALVGFALGHTPLRGSAFAMRHEVWQQTRSAVCRDTKRLHVDIDLSIHLAGPIVIDRTLAVPVSRERSTVNGRSDVRALRGLLTIVRHWPREFPLVRALRARNRSLTPVPVSAQQV